MIYTLKLRKGTDISYAYSVANSCKEAIIKTEAIEKFKDFEIIGVQKGQFYSF